MDMKNPFPYFEFPVSAHEHSIDPRMMDSNGTNQKDPMEKYELTVKNYMEAALISIISFVSIMGNVSIWIIVLRLRSLRTITNSFILALSAFDLLVAIVNMPVTVFTIFSGDWIFSDEACKGFGFSNMVTLCGSVLSLCNISINRYVMVCKSTLFSRIYTKKRAFLMIAATVAVTLMISSLPLLGWCKYTFIKEQYICFANWPLSLSYSLFMIFCCFGIPLSVMMFCNYKIYKQVRGSTTKISEAYQLTTTKTQHGTHASLSSDHSKSDDCGKYQQPYIDDQANVSEPRGNKRSYSIQVDVKPIENIVKSTTKATPEEVRLAMVLGIVVVVFFISWFPYCISMILSIAAPHSVHPSFYIIALLIGYSNSCYNPIIYGILNKRFANGFKKLYCFWR